jgi:hypothetical protein
MLPLIGVIVGGYIILRCVDVIARNDDSLQNNLGSVVVKSLVTIVLLITAAECWYLFNSGTTTGTAVDLLK